MATKFDLLELSWNFYNWESYLKNHSILVPHIVIMKDALLHSDTIDAMKSVLSCSNYFLCQQVSVILYST